MAAAELSWWAPEIYPPETEREIHGGYGHMPDLQRGIAPARWGEDGAMPPVQDNVKSRFPFARPTSVRKARTTRRQAETGGQGACGEAEETKGGIGRRSGRSRGGIAQGQGGEEKACP